MSNPNVVLGELAPNVVQDFGSAKSHNVDRRSGSAQSNVNEEGKRSHNTQSVSSHATRRTPKSNGSSSKRKRTKRHTSEQDPTAQLPHGEHDGVRKSSTLPSDGGHGPTTAKHPVSAPGLAQEKPPQVAVEATSQGAFGNKRPPCLDIGLMGSSRGPPTFDKGVTGSAQGSVAFEPESARGSAALLSDSDVVRSSLLERWRRRGSLASSTHHGGMGERESLGDGKDMHGSAQRRVEQGASAVPVPGPSIGHLPVAADIVLPVALPMPHDRPTGVNVGPFGRPPPDENRADRPVSAARSWDVGEGNASPLQSPRQEDLGVGGLPHPEPASGAMVPEVVWRNAVPPAPGQWEFLLHAIYAAIVPYGTRFPIFSASDLERRDLEGQSVEEPSCQAVPAQHGIYTRLTPTPWVWRHWVFQKCQRIASVGCRAEAHAEALRRRQDAETTRMRHELRCAQQEEQDCRRAQWRREREEQDAVKQRKDRARQKRVLKERREWEAKEKRRGKGTAGRSDSSQAIQEPLLGSDAAGGAGAASHMDEPPAPRPDQQAPPDMAESDARPTDAAKRVRPPALSLGVEEEEGLGPGLGGGVGTAEPDPEVQGTPHDSGAAEQPLQPLKMRKKKVKKSRGPAAAPSPAASTSGPPPPAQPPGSAPGVLGPTPDAAVERELDPSPRDPSPQPTPGSPCPPPPQQQQTPSPASTSHGSAGFDPANPLLRTGAGVAVGAGAAVVQPLPPIPDGAIVFRDAAHTLELMAGLCRALAAQLRQTAGEWACRTPMLPDDFFAEGTDGRHRYPVSKLVEHLSYAIEQRLLWTGPQCLPMFDRNGQLIRHAMPAAEERYGTLPYTLLPQQWLFNKCVPSPPQPMFERPSRGPQYYRMELDLLHIDFTDHHLFSKEHRLAAELRELYLSCRAEPPVAHFRQRQRELETTLGRLGRSMGNPLGASGALAEEVLADRRAAISKLEVEVAEARAAVADAEARHTQRIESMLQLWREIKELRQTEGTRTGVQLSFLRKPPSLRTVINARNLLRQHRAAHPPAEPQTPPPQSSTEPPVDVDPQHEPEEAHSVKSPTAGPSTRLSAAESGAELGPTDGEQLQKRDASQALNLVPNLRTDRPLTDPVDVAEANRRRQMQQTQYYATVTVNGKLVAGTPKAQLDPNFRVTFHALINLHLHRMPVSMTVQLYQSLGMGRWQLLANVPLQVPRTRTISAEDSLQRLRFEAGDRFVPDWEAPAAPGPAAPPPNARGPRLLRDSLTSSCHTTGGFLQLAVMWTNPDPAHPTTALPPLPAALPSKAPSQGKPSPLPPTAHQQSVQCDDSPRPGPAAPPTAAPDPQGTPEALRRAVLNGQIDPFDPGNRDAMQLLAKHYGHLLQSPSLCHPLRLSSSTGLPHALRLSSCSASPQPPDPLRHAVLLKPFRLLRHAPPKGRHATDNRIRLLQARHHQHDPGLAMLQRVDRNAKQQRRGGLTGTALTPEGDATPDVFAKPVPLKPRDIADSALHVPDPGAAFDDGPGIAAGLTEYQAAVRRKRLGRSKRPVAKLDILSRIVTQPVPPPDGDLLQRIVAFFAPLTQLRPVRRPPAPAPVAADVQHCTLCIHVLKGYNVPVRAPQALGNPPPVGTSARDATRSHGKTGKARSRAGPGGAASAMSHAPDEHDEFEGAAEDVEVFVVIRFRDRAVQSRCAHGPAPAFHELLQLPFGPPSFEPEALALIADEVTVDIYDKVTRELPKDSRDATTTHYREERRWLGSFGVPFPVLYRARRVEGTWRVNTPMATIGYSASGRYAEPPTAPGALDPEGPYGGVDPYTTLTLFMTLQPALPLPAPPADAPADPAEAPATFHAATAWERTLRQRLRAAFGGDAATGRTVRALASTFQGNAVLVSRYLCPQPPPHGLDTPALVARFVSLIPYVPDTTGSGALDDALWATSEELLDLGCGDYVEHAVLLANYFLYLQCHEEVYVVLGQSRTSFRAAFVLTRGARRPHSPHQPQCQLWDPVTGERYPASDRRNALVQAGTMFTARDIYVNCQPQGNAAQTGEAFFGVKGGSGWQRFAGHPPPEQCETVQKAVLQYVPPVDGDVLQMERDIREVLRTNIEGWRRCPTEWSPTLGQRLGNVLSVMEDQRRDHSSHLTFPDLMADLHRRELAEFIGYEMFGFPLNVKWTDMHHLLNAVRATAPEDNGDPSAVYALGLHLRPYACGVVSVWTYVATFCKVPGTKRF